MPHKLLLADDSVTIQRVIELTFADEDIHVIAVGDGKQAIERIQADRPDIVLADVGMPERDGYEVAAFVKGHPELAHVPVLLLTGAFEPIDEGRARGVGCDGVLVKPFEPQMVINRVKDLLAGRHPAGLWAAASLTTQQTPQPKPAPPADVDLRATSPAAAAARQGAGALEEYFDRLDAAFAELDSPAPPPSGQGAAPAGRAPFEAHAVDPADALAGWDPDLTGDPVRPSPASEPALGVAPQTAAPPPATAPTPPPAPEPAAARPAAAQAQPSAPAAVAEPEPAPQLPKGASLAEAFAALLSAEQAQPIALPSVRPEDIPDDTIEHIVRRVIERMGTSTVQQTVLDVAERMVREEIDKIKRGS
jgi:CheY-like chemotaxis protein